MARAELTINVSGDPSGGSNHGRNSRSPPLSIPEHYSAARIAPNSIPEHFATSQSPPPPSISEHVDSLAPLRQGAPSKESFRDYSGSIQTEARPSRHSSLTSRPTAASPPPMSYHSTTPFVQPQQKTTMPRASVMSMGTANGTNTTTVTTVIAAIEADPTNGWRPKWLRKTSVAIFASVFLLLGVAAEVIMAVADGELADLSIEGVWIFGPVIIISVVAALWWRVEFQALNYTPWIMLDIDQGKGLQGTGAKKRRASRTILLDYVSMGYPRALLTAIRNKHYLAAASIAISLLLRVQIFLSTGIFHVHGGVGTPRILILQPAILHTMVGIFGLIALLTLPMILLAPGSHGITPRDPTTIAGTAALLANSCQPMSRLSATGSQDMNVVAQRLQGSWCTTLLHQPDSRPTYEYRLELFESQTTVGSEKYADESEGSERPYNPWTHQALASIATILVSALLVAGLWAVFAIRGPARRFEAEDKSYFLWTSFITFLFVSLSMYVGSISFHVQRLAPYFKLLARACGYEESMGLNYTNAMGFRTLVKAARYRDWGVFITTIVAFIAWLLPIFSAGLFVDRQIERQVGVELQQQTFFKTDINTRNFSPNAGLVNDVLLATTPKYPAWTYEDLAYPSQHLVVDDSEWTASGKRIVATVPATRAALDCQMVSLTRSEGEDMECQPLIGNGRERPAVICDDNQYVGFTASSCSNLPARATFNYVWAACIEAATVSVLMCNETISNLSVETTFEGDGLLVSNTSIPIPTEESAQLSGIELGGDRAYELLRGTDPDTTALNGLDDFFRALVLSSRLEVTRERLGSPLRATSVAESIKKLHGIVRAQTLNSDAARTAFDTGSGSTPPAPLRATLVYFVRSVVQSTAQTALLTAGLALVMALTLVWLLALKPSPAALPKNPGSIAALASLLADSSLWWHLPRGVEWLAEEKLARRLRRKTFRLGWFEVMAPGPDGTTITDRACTIGVVQDNGRAMRAPWDEGEAWTGSSRRGADWRRPPRDVVIPS
ncbi:hypothetical protein HJFPF1_09289 [Paramyrothecium foliicola]|nr:hypothetical protein HJFPF1_09289 [Paramyrothecium foliicola]